MQAPFASVLDPPRRQPDERLLRTLQIVRVGTRVRARFVVECRAAGVEAIDCLCTFRDARCCGRRALREEVPIYAVATLARHAERSLACHAANASDEPPAWP